SLSYMNAYFIWRIIRFLFSSQKSLQVALLFATLFALLINQQGKTWGSWNLNCTPEEYEASDWILKNTDPQATIIANWYTGDYVRSLTERHILISDYPRIEVRIAMERSKLNIPILPKDPEQVINYTQEHSGNYYLLVSKWGPWGNYAANPHFTLLETF